MADYDNRILRGTAVADAGTIDAGLRAYMLRVYNYMMIGLALTGIAAYALYSLSVTSDPAQAQAMISSELGLTSFGVTLYTSPLRWVLMFAPLGAVLFLSFRVTKMSAASALMAFSAFALLMGASLSSIFLVYTTTSITQVFFITSAAFGGLSLYGYTTKRDLSGMGSFLIMGVWGLFIAGIVNIFMQSPMIMFVTSVLGVGIFAGLTAYDTQKIKEMYYVGDDGTLMGQKAILGALRLYLDFINMFIYLLQLVGNRR